MTTISIERHPNNDTRLPWRVFTYDMDIGSDIAKYVAREMFAWPGGYELYAITDDGVVLCHNCCRTEFYNIRTDGWNIVAMQSTAEDESHVYCDHCDKDIHCECETCHDTFDDRHKLFAHEIAEKHGNVSWTF